MINGKQISETGGNEMQCYFCAGKMKKGKTTYTLNRMGYHLDCQHRYFNRR